MTDNTKDRPLVKCADCLHCKQYREVAPGSGRYVLKVKCATGYWKQGRKRGATDLHRVLAKRRHGCDDYRTMSDSEEDRQRHLKHLADDLPLERITYEADGEPMDITEVEAWHGAM
jgi:hypothetical protein